MFKITRGNIIASFMFLAAGLLIGGTLALEQDKSPVKDSLSHPVQFNPNKTEAERFIVTKVVEVPGTQISIFFVQSDTGEGPEFRAINPSDTGFHTGDCVGLRKVNVGFDPDNKTGFGGSGYQGPYYTVVSVEVDGM